PVKKLYIWLKNWNINFNNRREKSTQNGQKNQIVNDLMTSKWKSNSKAVLISGSSGIGKTCSVKIVCKQLKIKCIEFNASHSRKKQILSNLLDEIFENRIISFKDNLNLSKNYALLMDEIDGMSSTDDRGGIQELIKFVKKATIPIIFIANDRFHPKIKSLANYCFDLRFPKPSLQITKKFMLYISQKENFQIEHKDLENLIISLNFDIRQILHFLSFFKPYKKKFD
ncbi:Replication factor C subunit-like protein, partial [Dinothrombium tinctorium]